MKPKRREYALSIHFSHFEVQDKQYVFVEVHNQTRNKELEAMINSYAKMMERNERELKREKERAEKLLLNIMPKSVLAELKQFGVTTPTRYDSASVIMIDFVSSTEMKISEDPTAVVTELNDIFTNLIASWNSLDANVSKQWVMRIWPFLAFLNLTLTMQPISLKPRCWLNVI